MKSKKVLIGILSASILSVTAFTAFALNADRVKTIDDINGTREILPISSDIDLEETINFNSFRGVVRETRDFEAVAGSKFVLVENEEGMLVNFIVAEDTYIVGERELKIGDKVTGFYDANIPVIMIYPAQYKAVVLAIDQEGQSVTVDLFDENLVNTDNSLKLNISKDTKIVLQDGSEYKGELVNQKLVVIYDFSTKSIPAQTTPRKVVVLTEVKEEEVPSIDWNVPEADLIVHNEMIVAPSAYRNENDMIMVPLRAIAEALGYEVKWQGLARRVVLDKEITLTIGEDSYTDVNKTAIQLGTAPELINGTTFVPLSFFREVLQMNNAYFFEGQIVIDNGEKMN